jgi:hypothetical protein
MNSLTIQQRKYCSNNQKCIPQIQLSTCQVVSMTMIEGVPNIQTSANASLSLVCKFTCIFIITPLANEYSRVSLFIFAPYLSKGLALGHLGTPKGNIISS